MKKWMIVVVLAGYVSAFAGEDGPDQETKEQFLQRVEKKSKKSGRPYERKVVEVRFHTMDTNEDGIVTREERRAQFKEAPSGGEGKDASTPAVSESRALGLLTS